MVGENQPTFGHAGKFELSIPPMDWDQALPNLESTEAFDSGHHFDTASTGLDSGVGYGELQAHSIEYP